MKIKKGDEIKVVAGKDKGKTGKVEKVLSKIDKVLIPGINEYKKHLKGNASGQRSEVITIAKPLPIANVMFVCPKCHETARIGYGIEGDKKVRICKKCKSSV
jgi:large subunit ribosomal protein L24